MNEINPALTKRYVLSVLLPNEFAAAERLLGTIRRRAPGVVDWSFQVEDPESVRFYVEFEASLDAARQLTHQVAKLIDVVEVEQREKHVGAVDRPCRCERVRSVP